MFSSASSPQGRVLSPFEFFTLLPNTRQSASKEKYLDDAVIANLLHNNELGHGPLVDSLKATR